MDRRTASKHFQRQNPCARQSIKKNFVIVADLPDFLLSASDSSLMVSPFVDVLAKLVCDVRLSDRLNVSRRLSNDASDVDFFGDPLPVAPASSSLSVRTYKWPMFSLIFRVLIQILLLLENTA